MRPFKKGGWRGVDLDGTLAYYDGWKGPGHIGEPIPLMVERVLRWLKRGDQVAIVTARVAQEVDRAEATYAIEAFCLEHLGQVIPITHQKDFQMYELWDDRAIQIIHNTGERADGHD
ncbi:MAG: hypothetical protein KAJ42_10590 [Gemmatimonadetes bacterium]|nr:hypothetical protein [Gemmatimonadota bacterium]